MQNRTRRKLSARPLVSAAVSAVVGTVVIAGVGAGLLGGCSSPMPRITPASAVVADAARPIVTDIIDDEIVVEVMINGRGPYRMILDTGAAASSIPPELARELGMTPRGSVGTVDSHGNRSTERIAHAQTVTLGGFELRDVPFTLSTLPALVTDDNDAVGVAGYNLFSRHTLVIDYPANAVRVSDERLGREGSLPLSLYNGHIPMVEAQFRFPHSDEGTESTFMLHTGSGATVEVSGFERILYGDSKNAIAIGATVSATGSIREANFSRLGADLNLGATTVTHITALLEEGDSPPIIGGGLMKLFRVTLDPVSKRARFEHPARVAQLPMPVWRVHGFRMDHDEDTGAITVAEVFPDSEAERGGLRTGDRIVAINGVTLGTTAAELAPLVGPTLNTAVSNRAFTVERGGQRLDLMLDYQDLIPDPALYPRTPVRGNAGAAADTPDAGPHTAPANAPEATAGSAQN